MRVALKRAGQADDGVDALNARKQQGNAHVDHQRRRAVEGVEDHQHAEHSAHDAQQQIQSPAAETEAAQLYGGLNGKDAVDDDVEAEDDGQDGQRSGGVGKKQNTRERAENAHDQVEAEEDADDADAEVAGDLAHAHGDAQRAGEIAHGQRGDVGAEDHRGAQHDHAAGYDDGPETVTL